MVKPALSLKARALAMLARREHSRAELRRKLLPHARAAALAAAVQAQTPSDRTPARAGVPATAATGAAFFSDLHRSPGPAPVRPGVFSSQVRQKRAGGRRGGGVPAHAAVGEGAERNADADADRDADRDEEAPEAGGSEPAVTVDTVAAWAEAEHAVEELLDWLQAQRYLSEQRFMESRVHARAGRFGNLRIRQELAQHGVALDADAAQRLHDSELERCRAVWARKFGGTPPADAAERARQMRFLAGRGFSADVIRRVLQASED